MFFSLGLPLKSVSTEKLIKARLGVSRTIYVNVDSPNLGFPYFNFLGEAQCKKRPVFWNIQLTQDQQDLQSCLADEDTCRAELVSGWFCQQLQMRSTVAHINWVSLSAARLEIGFQLDSDPHHRHI